MPNSKPLLCQLKFCGEKLKSSNTHQQTFCNEASVGCGICYGKVLEMDKQQSDFLCEISAFLCL